MRHAVIVLAALAALPAAAGGAAAADPARDVSAQFRGASTTGRFMQRAAEAYMALQPDTLISVLPANTYRTYKGVINGTVDVGLTAGDIDADLKKQAQLARLTLVVKPFGIEAIAVVVHPANPVAGLTMEQLRQILAGEATTWDAVGGPKQPIAVILPPPSDAVINFIKAAVITSGSLTPRQRATATDTVGARVAADPAAIGVIPLSYVDPGDKVLALGGVLPSPETMKAKSYPLTRTLRVAYLDTAPHTAVDFAKFITEPKGGQKLLDVLKAVPLGDAP